MKKTTIVVIGVVTVVGIITYLVCEVKRLKKALKKAVNICFENKETDEFYNEFYDESIAKEFD